MKANALGKNTFLYNFNEETKVEYTLAPWVPLTAKYSFLLKTHRNHIVKPIDSDCLPLEGRLNKKVGVADVFLKITLI